MDLESFKNSGTYVSIILPTYNEAENVERLIKDTVSVLNASKFEAEIIVVDDNSQDGTAEIVRGMGKGYGNVFLVSNPSKQGIGKAYQRGVKESRGAIVVTMDADLSHSPDYIPAMVNQIEEGAGISVGSRYVPKGKIIGWGAYRKFMSCAANASARALLGLGTMDITSGYRAYSRSALKKIGFADIKVTGYSFLTESLYNAEKAGLKVSETPITFVDRNKGKSKLGLKEQLNFLSTLARLFLHSSIG